MFTSYSIVNGAKSHSFATFYSITVAAKHLAVFYDGSATVTPWFYMVSLHFFQLEVLAAMRTNAFLAFISFSFLFFCRRCEN